MALIGELYSPDVAILPIGDFFTMGPLEAAKAVELLGVKQVVPMHYGTFPLLTGTPQGLRDELAKRGLGDVRRPRDRPGRHHRMTFSLVACDLEAGEWGVSVASKFLAVGAVVPWAQGDVGAVATQSYANVTYGQNGLALLAGGADAQTALDRLVADDAGRDQRQAGIVDATGGSATFTGQRLLRVGRRPHRPVLRRPGQHPRRPGGGRRAGRHLPRHARARWPNACWRPSPPRTPPAATAVDASRRA